MKWWEIPEAFARDLWPLGQILQETRILVWRSSEKFGTRCWKTKKDPKRKTTCHIACFAIANASEKNYCLVAVATYFLKQDTLPTFRRKETTRIWAGKWYNQEPTNPCWKDRKSTFLRFLAKCTQTLLGSCWSQKEHSPEVRWLAFQYFWWHILSCANKWIFPFHVGTVPFFLSGT